MKCDCNKLDCSKCTVEITIVETTICYVPRSKYEKLKDKYEVDRLAHIQENRIELSRNVNRASEEIIITMLQIKDEEC